MDRKTDNTNLKPAEIEAELTAKEREAIEIDKYHCTGLGDGNDGVAPESIDLLARSLALARIQARDREAKIEDAAKLMGEAASHINWLVKQIEILLEIDPTEGYKASLQMAKGCIERMDQWAGISLTPSPALPAGEVERLRVTKHPTIAELEAALKRGDNVYLSPDGSATVNTPRESVRWFAEQMEAKLKAHDDRPGWKSDTFTGLFNRLTEEVGELDLAIHVNPRSFEAPYRVGLTICFNAIIAEAADVANFAMMIADNAKSALGGGKG